MITEQDLQEAIAECDGQRNPSSSTCVKLAAFYTIKDRMYPENSGGREQVPAIVYSTAAHDPNVQAEYHSDTEFGQMIPGMDMDALLAVIDELMSTLQVICPRLYAGVIRKLSELK